MSDMLDKLRQLARIRSEYDTTKRHYDEMYRRFLDSAKFVIDELALYKSSMECLEQCIRKDAITEYGTSGLKELDGGVRIRIVHDIEITDMDAALLWCIDHKLALTPDVRQLKELSKLHEMPFIKTTMRPQATIPKDIVVIEESR